jgi:hypothetical protein
MSEQIKSSNMIADFIKVQQNLPSVGKDGKGNFGKYMKLEDIMPKVIDVLNKNNFIVIQSPTITEEGSPALTTTLTYYNGEVLAQDTMLLMLDKQTAQGQGSGITYARRYALCAMLGLVADEDDDGQKATDQSGGQTKPAPRPSDPNKFISPAQINLVFARLKSKGIQSKDEANSAVYDLTGKDSVAEVTMGEMTDLLNGIDKMPDLSE